MNPAPVNLIRDYLDNVQVHLDTVQYTKVSTSWGSVLPMPEVTRLYFIRDGAGYVVLPAVVPDALNQLVHQDLRTYQGPSGQFWFQTEHIQSVMGVSPMVYVNRKRIEKAKRWLWESDLSIREIAERLGLEGYYFSRLFKHHTGISPSAYRASRVFE